jgi:hypothetical protein
MNAAYGYHIESKNDKLVALVDEHIALSNSLSIPGNYRVETLLKSSLIKFRQSRFHQDHD